MSDVDAIVSAHLGLAAAMAASTARQLRVPGSLRQDLEAAAREGLFDAARRFDEGRGVPFSAFARARIRGAMTDALRREGALSRRAYARLSGLEGVARIADSIEDDGAAAGTARELDARLSDHLTTMATALALGLHAPPDDGPRAAAPSEDLDETAETRLARQQTRAALRAALQSLEEPDRSLIDRHYFQGEDLFVLARELGYSPSWASRVHARAVKALGRALGPRAAHAW
ncbi:MAG: sigma-70 family RNA polymerase sigma factor [Polyangiaceae bacterium]|nr:sigma-70 family RNA polymerase sigma factor [Polyangiaceae bacterium]